MSGFWVFLTVIYVCDSYLFSKGFDSLFHRFKTDEEKELRRNLINNKFVNFDKIRNEVIEECIELCENMPQETATIVMINKLTDLKE